MNWKDFEIKSFKLAELTLEDQPDETRGVFTGYANVTGIKDRVGEIVEPGAFKRSIDHKDGRFPLLHHHDPQRAIGAVELVEDEKGLRVVRGELNLEKALAREIYSDLKFYEAKGMAMEMSIGFQRVGKPTWDAGQQAFRTKEVKLLEVSLLAPFAAANPLSTVDNVKDSSILKETLARLDERLSSLEDAIKAAQSPAPEAADLITSDQPPATDAKSGPDLHPLPEDPAEPTEVEMLRATLEAIRGD